jgi:hypothetical protein
MDDAIQGPFLVRTTGNVGQIILDSDSRIIAWTTDPWVALVIARLLGDNEDLLLLKKGGVNG